MSEEQKEEIEFKDSVLINQNKRFIYIKKAYSEKEKELSLLQFDADNCQSEKAGLNRLLSKQQKRTQLFKTGFFIVGGVALVETFILLLN